MWNKKVEEERIYINGLLSSFMHSSEKTRKGNAKENFHFILEKGFYSTFLRATREKFNKSEMSEGMIYS